LRRRSTPRETYSDRRARLRRGQSDPKWDALLCWLAASPSGRRWRLAPTDHVCIWRLVPGPKPCKDEERLVGCRPPGTDHASLWLDRDGQAVYVSQPYDLESETLRAMLAFADRWGLGFTINGEAWHHPAALLVVWRRARQSNNSRDGSVRGGD
jgi:hypothetical protein